MEDEHKPSLESLLQDMIANQQSIHTAIEGLYDKITELENTITAVQEEKGEMTQAELAQHLYDSVKTAVIKAEKASTSWIQRKFRIGYSLAAELMDRLEDDGIIGLSGTSAAIQSRPIRQIQVGRRPRAICCSERFVIPINTINTRCYAGRAARELRRVALAFPGQSGRFTCRRKERAWLLRR
jgi:ribosomal protein S25